MRPTQDHQPSPFLPACLVCLAAAAAALACAFFFRGPDGDYNLYYIMEPAAHGNEYVPPDASRTLAFPRLVSFACVWGAVVLGGWLVLARALARREGVRTGEALRRAAVAFYPLIALLVVPAHHFLGWPLTLGPVFLLISCIGLCVAVATYLLRPKFDGRWGRALCSPWAACVLALIYVAVFSTLFLLKYRALRVGFADSGIFAEAVFHGSQGEALRTNWETTGIVFEPHAIVILVPISYLYRLWPRHELLLILQTVALGSAGVAVYLLARAVLRDRAAAMCLAAAWLLAPTTAYVNLPSGYGFRPMALLAPMLLWAMCFLERRAWPWYFLFAFLALYVKETAAPVLVMLGVFIAVRHRRWGIAAATVVLAVGWFVLATRVIQPAALDRAYRFPGLLDHFGSTPGEVSWHIVRHPLDTLAYIFGSTARVFLLLHLLVPLLLVPLLSPSASLVWLASAAILLMANFYGKHIILIGAQSPALAGLYLAAAYGLRNLAERPTAVLRRLLPAGVFGDRERVLRAAAVGVVAASLAAHYFFFVRTVPWGRFVVGERAKKVAELRRRIPRDASLCASYRLASHFTDQAELFVAPINLGGTDHIVLDLYDDVAGLATMASYRSHILRSGRYAPTFADDGFLIFQRGGGGDLASSYRLRHEPTCQYTVGKSLEGFAALIGYDARPTRAGLELTLFWRCERPTDADYAVRLVVAGEEQPTAWRRLPADGVLPTWAWRPGDVICDQVTLPGVALPLVAAPLLDVGLEPIPAREIKSRVLQLR